MTKMRIRAKLFQATLMASLMLAAMTGAVAAGAIEDGSAAYQRHDYETALRLLRGPAEQGSAEAQLFLRFGIALIGETLLGAHVTIAEGMKPANARLLSAAIRDTSDVWVASILPGDRPTILGMLAKAKDASQDDETRKNLAALDVALRNAK